MFTQHSHCSYCGHPFEADQAWPRLCAACGNTSFVNPLPVSVVLLPVDDGLLTVRRNIAPQIGQLALPGGHTRIGRAAQRRHAPEAAVFAEESQDHPCVDQPQALIYRHGERGDGKSNHRAAEAQSIRKRLGI
jgi:hypothetical protein